MVPGSLALLSRKTGIIVIGRDSKILFVEHFEDDLLSNVFTVLY